MVAKSSGTRGTICAGLMAFLLLLLLLLHQLLPSQLLPSQLLPSQLLPSQLLSAAITAATAVSRNDRSSAAAFLGVKKLDAKAVGDSIECMLGGVTGAATRYVMPLVTLGRGISGSSPRASPTLRPGNSV